MEWLPWNHAFGGSHDVGLALCNSGSPYLDDGLPVPQRYAAAALSRNPELTTAAFDEEGYFKLASGAPRWWRTATGQMRRRV